MSILTCRLQRSGNAAGEWFRGSWQRAKDARGAVWVFTADGSFCTILNTSGFVTELSIASKHREDTLL